MPPATAPSRRQRLRTEALAEIREHGYAQIAEGGPTALSLNGIAKAMGMSGPALYRYFASRDELLVTLITESYEDLAGTLGEAARRARGGEPGERLRAALDACRRWALAQPHRYRLVFASSYGSGTLDPERIIPAAQRSMSVVLAAVAELGPSDQAPAVPDDILAHQLAAWGNRSSDDSQLEPSVLLLGLVAWTRMHGIISLEIEGFFDQVGVDPAHLYRSEIDHLIAERSGAVTAEKDSRSPA
jgi:AcrR family transcriptional regulator